MLTGEKRRTDRKSCHSATLSSTDLTLTDLGSNPGLCSERPSNDRLSYAVAVGSTKCTCIIFMHSLGCSAQTFWGKHIVLETSVSNYQSSPRNIPEERSH